LRVIFWKLATFYSYRNLKKLINVNSDISQNLVKIFYVKKYNGEYLKYSPRLGNALTKTALSKYSIWTIEHIHTRLYMNHITPHPPHPRFPPKKYVHEVRYERAWIWLYKLLGRWLNLIDHKFEWYWTCRVDIYWL